LQKSRNNGRTRTRCKKLFFSFQKKYTKFFKYDEYNAKNQKLLLNSCCHRFLKKQNFSIMEFTLKQITVMRNKEKVTPDWYAVFQEFLQR
jgi:hypothetical protein